MQSNKLHFPAYKHKASSQEVVSGIESEDNREDAEVGSDSDLSKTEEIFDNTRSERLQDVTIGTD